MVHREAKSAHFTPLLVHRCMLTAGTWSTGVQGGIPTYLQTVYGRAYIPPWVYLPGVYSLVYSLPRGS